MNYDPKKIKTANSRDLNDLHPIVKTIAENFIKESNEFLKSKGYEVKVISTLRSFEEQKRLYNIGRVGKKDKNKIVTNALPGSSLHNWGCAFDLGVFKDNTYIDREDPNTAKNIYFAIFNIAKKYNLTWGGSFITFKDNPHYQYTGKHTGKDFLLKANNGISLDILLS